MYASSWRASTRLDSFTWAAYRVGTGHLVAYIKEESTRQFASSAR
jgi:hypothetical protein